MTKNFAQLDAARPPLPQETCPLIDCTSTLADAIAADVDRIRRELEAKGDGETAAELGEVVSHNLQTLRLKYLEPLREKNAELRTSALYWREGAEGLTHALEQPIAADQVEAWLSGADVAELERVALAIKARVAGVAAELEGGASFQ